MVKIFFYSNKVNRNYSKDIQDYNEMKDDYRLEINNVLRSVGVYISIKSMSIVKSEDIKGAMQFSLDDKRYLDCDKSVIGALCKCI